MKIGFFILLMTAILMSQVDAFAQSATDVSNAIVLECKYPNNVMKSFKKEVPLEINTKTGKSTVRTFKYILPGGEIVEATAEDIAADGSLENVKVTRPNEDAFDWNIKRNQNLVLSDKQELDCKVESIKTAVDSLSGFNYRGRGQPSDLSKHQFQGSINDTKNRQANNGWDYLLPGGGTAPQKPAPTGRGNRGTN